MEIGKLEEVDIRSLWKHEQYDFSDFPSGIPAWLPMEKEENTNLIE